MESITLTPLEDIADMELIEILLVALSTAEYMTVRRLSTYLYHDGATKVNVTVDGIPSCHSLPHQTSSHVFTVYSHLQRFSSGLKASYYSSSTF
jgi:hypothetical protein